VIDFRNRAALRMEFSGGGTLAAASPRARCVLADGWPVLRVHCSFGLARHMGQRTDSMCRNVSSGFTPVLFNIAILRDGQSCSRQFNFTQNGKLLGTRTDEGFRTSGQNSMLPSRMLLHTPGEKGASFWPIAV
jgi:hypothetical protein